MKNSSQITTRLLLLAFLFSFSINAQKRKGDYKSKISDPTANFFEIVKQKRAELSQLKKTQTKLTKTDEKAIKQFERWVWIWKDRVNGDGTFPQNISKESLLNLYAQKSLPLSRGSHTPYSYSNASWEQIGPVNNPAQNGYTAYPGKGRVNVVAVNPNNSQIMYAGSAAGGIWKTIDGGTNWSPKSDNLAGLGVADILIDPNNTSIIYMATGDPDAEHISSIGLYKSTDAGETWVITGLSFSLSDNEYIRDIIFAPGSSTKIFALTNTEVRVTTDSGASWNNVPVTYPFGAFTENFVNIIFDPNDVNKVVISDLWGGLYFSTDGGVNFAMHDVYQGGNSKKILRLTTTANDNDYFYGILQEASGGVEAKFKKYRFAFDNTGADEVSSIDLTGFNSQGGYNQCLAVSPTDKNNIMLGGVKGYKSTDNGATFTVLLNPYNDPPGVGFYVHPDHHYLGFLADGITVINGHDGGVHKGSFNATAGSGGWTDLSNTLVITQPYTIAVGSTLNTDNYMMGNQDNDGYSKVKVGKTSQWVSAVAGDGTATGIDPTDANIRYLGGVLGTLYKTTDGYASSYDSAVTLLSSGAQGVVAFVSPFEIDPNNSNTLYAGYGDVYKSTNDQGASFVNLNSGLTLVSQINVSKNGANTRLYVIGDNGVKRSDDSGTNWTDINSLGNTVNSITAEDNSLVAYCTIKGYDGASKVKKTTDGGATWVEYGIGLPNIVMKKIVLHQTRKNETLYLGTELGIYYKDNSMTNWIKLGTDLPNVIVVDIDINYANDNLYIGTFGRGMWRYNAQKAFAQIDNDRWVTANNWEGTTLPISTDNLLVPAGTTMTIEATTHSANSIEIINTGLLQIQTQARLTLTDRLISPSDEVTVKLYNFATSNSPTLLVEGNATAGLVEYRRTISGNLGDWSIVSPPVAGQKIKGFALNATNNIKINTTPDPDRYGIAIYNDANTVGNKWVYYDANMNAALTFTSGKGYSIGSTGNRLYYSGVLITDNKSVIVEADKWNAIGNPYTTFYPVNKNTDSNFIDENAANLATAAVYIWSANLNKYLAFTNLAPSSDRSLAPGQGFFVKTKIGSTSLQFDKNKRSVTPIGDGKFDEPTETERTTGSTTPFIKLSINKGNIILSTDIIYDENATRGYDEALDILNYDAVNLDVYTQLIEDTTGNNYTMQSIPKDYENLVIPVGIKVKENDEITFSVESFDLPSNLKIYIEDRVTSTFYRLDEDDSSFKIIFTEEVTGFGRFYLRTTASTLSVDTVVLDNVTIYNNNKTLFVKGIDADNFKLTLFDVTGKQLISKQLSRNSNNSIDLSNLSTGIYVVKVNSLDATKTKKIIIQ